MAEETQKKLVQFAYVAKKADVTAEQLAGNYANYVIFAKEDKAIWAQGIWYDGVSPETTKTIDNKINELKYFASVTDGTGTKAGAPKPGAALKFIGTEGVNVTVGEAGVTIKFADGAIATGTANGTIKVNGKDVAVQGLTQLAYTDPTTIATKSALDAVKATADSKIANVSAKTGEAVSVSVTDHVATVGLNINNATGDNAVKLEQTADGLKATVATPVTVKADDKILSKADGNVISAKVSLNYNSTDKTIELLGKDGVKFSSIDARNFIKDGMVKTASLVETAESGVTGIEVPYIKIEFQTTEGKAAEPVRFSVKKLVDIYDGANLKLSNAYVTAAAYDAPVKGESVDVAIGKLAKGVADAKASGVLSVGGKAGALTLKSTTADKTVSLAISDGGEISASLNLDTSKWDAALQKVSVDAASDPSLVKLTVTDKASNEQKLKVETVTADPSTATPTTVGLALAKDVHAYVEAKDASVRADFAAADDAIKNKVVALDAAYKAADTSNLNAAKAYTDEKKLEITNAYAAADTSLKNYVDTQDTSIYNASKKYTDDKLTWIELPTKA